MRFGVVNIEPDHTTIIVQDRTIILVNFRTNYFSGFRSFRFVRPRIFSSIGVPSKPNRFRS